MKNFKINHNKIIYLILIILLLGVLLFAHFFLYTKLQKAEKYNQLIMNNLDNYAITPVEKVKSLQVIEYFETQKSADNFQAEEINNPFKILKELQEASTNTEAVE